MYQVKKFDGGLFLAQLMLLIDSPMHGNIDIHGFGKGDPNISTLVHGVIGYSLSRHLCQIRFQPSMETNKLISSDIYHVSYKDHLGESTKIKYKYLYIIWNKYSAIISHICL